MPDWRCKQGTHDSPSLLICPPRLSRFTLRDKDKVSTQWWLFFLAHHIEKSTSFAGTP